MAKGKNVLHFCGVCFSSSTASTVAQFWFFCSVAQHCAVLCCIVLCCAVLCCAVLCCVVLCCCYTALCHAVPCRAMQKPEIQEEAGFSLFAAYDYSVLTQRPK